MLGLESSAWSPSARGRSRGTHRGIDRGAAAAAAPARLETQSPTCRELAALPWCALSELGGDARTRRAIEAGPRTRSGLSRLRRRLGSDVELESMMSCCVGWQKVCWAGRRAREVGPAGGARTAMRSRAEGRGRVCMACMGQCEVRDVAGTLC